MTETVAYPPEPWRLRGDFVVAVFLVPAARIPAHVALPPGARPLRLAGRVVVGVAAVHYGAGGVLAYDELLVAIPVRRGAGWWVTIPQIWVTSPRSRAGGRELWGIPKELMTTWRRVSGVHWDASYRVAGASETAAAAPAGAAGEEPGTVAEVSAAASRLRFPWSVPLPLRTLQRLDARTIGSRNSVRGIVRRARSRWRFDGPLAWLRPFAPVASVAITRADVVFGERVDR